MKRGDSVTIEKRGNKYRIKEMRNGITYRLTLDYEPKKREAEDLIRALINEQNPSADVRDTFEKSAMKYIQIRSNVISPSTIRGYHGILTVLSDRFKSTRTTAITQELVQMEVNNYSATHSPKSTRNLHGFISAVLSVYKPNMILRTTLPQKDKFEPYTPTESEVKKVLEYVAGTKYEIPYRLACYGLRRSEVCAITSADLDGNFLRINKAYVTDENEEWHIKKYPKTTESNRAIYIDDKLADLIRNKKGRMFEGHPSRLNDHLKEILQRIGLPRFRLHDFRAYYASMAHALGIPDAYIMQNGGWSSTHILNRSYKRTIEDLSAEANKKISSHLG